MRKLFLVLISVLTWASVACPASAAEKVLWQIGQRDQSSHEFEFSPTADTPLPVVVSVARGHVEKAWPRYQPGSGNANYGNKPYPYTLVFNLDGKPASHYTLDLDLLPKQPRAPAVLMEVNGHQGLYYVDPRTTFTIGDTDDVSIRCTARPACTFRLPELSCGKARIN